MKVLATADTHGNLPEVPADTDLLIHAGDICPDFAEMSFGPGYAARARNGDQRQRHWLDTAFRGWLWDLNAQGTQVIGIAGNHDFVFEKSFLVPDDMEWTYLKDQEVCVGLGYAYEGGRQLLPKKRLRIYGTPWVPNLRNWAFYGRHEFLEERAQAIPEGLDILITHGPPLGSADEVSGAGHVGDEPLRHRLMTMERPPKAVVTGHIHEGFGIYKLRPDCTLYSVSYVDEAYNPNRPLVRLWEFA